jgi:hypothetical protein
MVAGACPEVPAERAALRKSPGYGPMEPSARVMWAWSSTASHDRWRLRNEVIWASHRCRMVRAATRVRRFAGQRAYAGLAVVSCRCVCRSESIARKVETVTQSVCATRCSDRSSVALGPTDSTNVD